MKTKDIKIAVVLAAGEGTRMKSSLPKVLVKVGQKPMLAYVIDNLMAAGLQHILVVVGFAKEKVEAWLTEHYSDQFFKRPQELPLHSTRELTISSVVQQNQLGTANALLACEPLLLNLSTRLLVTCGDMPLMSKTSFKNIIQNHQQQEAAMMSILSAKLPDPNGYGRIIRDANQNFVKITEEKDATDDEKKVLEVNSATYILQLPECILDLKKINNQNQQKEYYLTDLAELYQKVSANKVHVFCIESHEQIQGVNTELERQKVQRVLEMEA